MVRGKILILKTRCYRQLLQTTTAAEYELRTIQLFFEQMVSGSLQSLKRCKYTHLLSNLIETHILHNHFTEAGMKRFCILMIYSENAITALVERVSYFTESDQIVELFAETTRNINNPAARFYGKPKRFNKYYCWISK